MVDNLAGKVDKCPLIGVVKYCLHTLGLRKLSVIWSSGVSANQGLLKYWRTVGTFRIVHYIVGVCCWGVSIKQGSTVVACVTSSLHSMAQLAFQLYFTRSGSGCQVKLRLPTWSPFPALFIPWSGGSKLPSNTNWSVSQLHSMASYMWQHIVYCLYTASSNTYLSCIVIPMSINCWSLAFLTALQSKYSAAVNNTSIWRATKLS